VFIRVYHKIVWSNILVYYSSKSPSNSNGSTTIKREALYLPIFSVLNLFCTTITQRQSKLGDEKLENRRKKAAELVAYVETDAHPNLSINNSDFGEPLLCTAFLVRRLHHHLIFVHLPMSLKYAPASRQSSHGSFNLTEPMK